MQDGSEAENDVVLSRWPPRRRPSRNHWPQAKPQENPPGVETFVINGEAGVLFPNAKGLRWGAAGIHMLVQNFMPSAKVANGFMAKGLKPCKIGENDIGSCVALARKAPKGDGRAPDGSPKPENVELMKVTASRTTRSKASAAVS